MFEAAMFNDDVQEGAFEGSDLDRTVLFIPAFSTFVYGVRNQHVLLTVANHRLDRYFDVIMTTGKAGNLRNAG